MKTFCWFLAAAAVATGIAKVSQATTITNTTTSAIVFSDSYENQTAGATLTSANITPGPGAYSSPPSGAKATNAANPGPYEGLNYISIDRQNGAVTGANTRLVHTLSTAIAIGNTMHVSLAYQLDSGYFEVMFLNGSTTIFGLFASPDDTSGLWQTFTQSGQGSGQFASALTVGNYDAWHELAIDYVAGSTSVTITRDGQSETIASITSASNANRTVSTMRLTGDGSSTSHFYVDAVPEPTSIVLISSALVFAGVQAWRRKRLF